MWAEAQNRKIVSAAMMVAATFQARSSAASVITAHAR
jgi:hypothetical protein